MQSSKTTYINKDSPTNFIQRIYTSTDGIYTYNYVRKIYRVTHYYYLYLKDQDNFHLKIHKAHVLEISESVSQSDFQEVKKCSRSAKHCYSLLLMYRDSSERVKRTHLRKLFFFCCLLVSTLVLLLIPSRTVLSSYLGKATAAAAKAASPSFTSDIYQNQQTIGSNCARTLDVTY